MYNSDNENIWQILNKIKKTIFTKNHKHNQISLIVDCNRNNITDSFDIAYQFNMKLGIASKLLYSYTMEVST